MMSKFIVRGGNKLTGSVKVSGAKNSVLPIIAASLLGEEGVSVIHDAPPLDDVITISKVLESIGAGITYDNNVMRVDAQAISSCEAPYEWVRKMRASFLVMGPLLARMGHTRISLPGGCAIGTRPIDQHLKGFEALGAEISLGQGYIEAKINGRLRGAKIYLDVASVGATENIMMAATLAEGVTIIENAAKEPEIVDLANYLNGMGAKVRGAGTGVIRIEGVEKLHGTEHTVIPDRIEVSTFMVAAAIRRRRRVRGRRDCGPSWSGHLQNGGDGRHDRNRRKRNPRNGEPSAESSRHQNPALSRIPYRHAGANDGAAA